MKRIQVSALTRIVAGSYIRFLLLLIVPPVTLPFISLSLDMSENVESRIWALQMAMLMIGSYIAFYTYVFMRLGVFYDDTILVERSLFKSRVFSFKDISSLNLDSTLPGASMAASNNIIIRQAKTNANSTRAYELKTTAMMFSRRRSRSFGCDLWEVINKYKPNAKLSISSSSIIWKDFKEFLHTRDDNSK